VGWLELDVVKPDVVVYLQASTDTLLERIHHRNRSFERDMEREYIERLNQAYNHYFFHYHDSPLLVVNTNNIDFVHQPDDFEDLLKRILSHRQGTLYYTPLEKGGPA
jgi:deoxyadenosine/deoxycytidine kinase